MNFEVRIRNIVDIYISNLPEKSRRIIKNCLNGLEESPYPGSIGDKERIVLRDGRDIYRLHIARTFTAFYSIDKENKVVKVHDLLTAEQAHKMYGRL